jgi:hypothetical protein
MEPANPVRNHGICTHGVHQTNRSVRAQYPVTAQETIKLAWYWCLSVPASRTSPRPAPVWIADPAGQQDANDGAEQQGCQGIVGIVAHHGCRVGKKSGQQEQGEVKADHRCGYMAHLVEQLVVLAPADPDEVEGEDGSVEGAVLTGRLTGVSDTGDRSPIGCRRLHVVSTCSPPGPQMAVVACCCPC